MLRPPLIITEFNLSGPSYSQEAGPSIQPTLPNGLVDVEVLINRIKLLEWDVWKLQGDVKDLLQEREAIWKLWTEDKQRQHETDRSSLQWAVRAMVDIGSRALESTNFLPEQDV